MYAMISCSQPVTLEQAIHQILALGKISKMDQDLIWSIAKNGLSDRERMLMTQLGNALRMGRLAVV